MAINLTLLEHVGTAITRKDHHAVLYRSNPQRGVCECQREGGCGSTSTGASIVLTEENFPVAEEKKVGPYPRLNSFEGFRGGKSGSECEAELSYQPTRRYDGKL
jgi:hypothetical protein